MEVPEILAHRMQQRGLTTHAVAEYTMDMINKDAIFSDGQKPAPQWSHEYVRSALRGKSPGAATMIDAIDTYVGTETPEPTDSIPGTEERIAAYERRYELGQSLFDSRDAVIAH